MENDPLATAAISLLIFSGALPVLYWFAALALDAWAL